MRRKSGEIWVTSQAPPIEPVNPMAAAGSMVFQRICTLWLNCQVATAVPQIDALLLVPNSVAGCAVGKMANSAGVRIRPPPPTIESTKPASSEASDTTIHSMPALSHPQGDGPSMAVAQRKRHRGYRCLGKNLHLVADALVVVLIRDVSSTPPSQGTKARLRVPQL